MKNKIDNIFEEIIKKHEIDHLQESDLQKGSLQRRNPFNPLTEENRGKLEEQRKWTHGEDDEVRQKLPYMDKAARLRALNKLAARTPTRKHPETGERLFLMHRGMGREEYNGAHDHKRGITNYQDGERTSWTSRYDVPYDFASKAGGVVSAWIPESAIVHSVKQFNAPDNQAIADRKKPFGLRDSKGRKKTGGRSLTESEEDEFIVEHIKPFHHADKDFMDDYKDQKSLERFGPNDWGLKQTPSIRAQISRPNRFGNLQGEDRKQIYNEAINLKTKFTPPNQTSKAELFFHEDSFSLNKNIVEDMYNVLEEIKLPKGKKFYHTEDGRIFEINENGNIIKEVFHHLDNEDIYKNEENIKPKQPQVPKNTAISQSQKKHPLHDFLKKMPNSNWKDWVKRNYKKDPNSFTKEIQDHITHFNGMNHIPDIKNARFDTNHSFEDGVNLLKQKENEYIERTKKNTNFASKPETAKKILDLGNGRAWWSLGKNYCQSEGKAMGHCGNKPSAKNFHDVLSLRTEHNLGGKKYYEPHLTFINNKNTNVLGEMKGRANEKPAKRYHQDIVNLLKLGYTPFGGGYLSENNFHPDDLDENHVEELMKTNPRALFGHKEKMKEIGHHFVNHPDIDVRMSVAKHPNTPLEILHKLSDDEDNYVRMSVAKHSNTSPEILHKLSDDEDNYVRMSVAEHPNTPLEILHKLSDDEGRYVRMSVAEHSNTSPEILHKLSNDEEGGVRRSVAKHPNTPLEILHKLSDDEDNYVRMSVAEHPNTPLEILHKLSDDEDNYVRMSVAKHSNTSPEILHKLSDDEEGGVRRSVAKHPNTPLEILHKLSDDEERYVRMSVAENPNTSPEILHKLSDDEERYVRMSVAENPNIPLQILHKLSDDEDNYVRMSVAEHSNTPLEILHKLSDDKVSEVKNSAKEALKKLKQKNINKSEDMKKSDSFIRRGILLAALAGTAQQAHNNLLEQKQKASRPYASQKQSIIEKPKTEPEKTFDEAEKQAFGIAAKHLPLSRNLARATIKANPDLYNEHGYLMHLSPSAFNEVIESNPEIKKEIALRHYDKLHQMFNGNRDKIFETYRKNSAKIGTYKK